MKVTSDWIIPVMLLVILTFGVLKKTDVYSHFTTGLKDGAAAFLKICPALFALFICVGVFRASGLSDFFCTLLSPVASFFHFPKDLLPFSILRPVSGSGSLVFAQDIFSRFGPDSFEGRAVSIMMGSTETTFYTASVYFAASGTKNIRHTIKCALIADVFSMAISILVTRLYYY
ncbi:MAG: spore maturation protein [Clostridia bacterium]|nr:spore maturation protein [Clostridia bacterium]